MSKTYNLCLDANAIETFYRTFSLRPFIQKQLCKHVESLSIYLTTNCPVTSPLPLYP